MSDDPDEKRIRYQRAKTAIDDAGWAFDEYEAKLTEGWKATAPEQGGDRELIYHRLRALKGLKDGLESVVNQYQNDEAIRERKSRDSAGS